MFPAALDGAQVLYYSSQGHYGVIRYTTGEIADHIRYFAICQYKDDESYYLFGCNEDYEVVSDTIWNSMNECMKAAVSCYTENIVWHRAE